MASASLRQRLSPVSRRTTWATSSVDEPWVLEAQLISRLDLPLNLDQNRHNAFHSHLKELRAQARRRARELPISA
ncbi:GIY-YIG nuclease family protein [Streptomyces olivaceoviridis]|uniref:GIY-YIG nuclease family protein n=1 Tax=Streptomyces olivaceoviridis TaxID=1921 RepID=UPI0036F8BAC3